MNKLEGKVEAALRSPLRAPGLALAGTAFRRLKLPGEDIVADGLTRACLG